MTTREMIATIIGIVAFAAVFLGLVGAAYYTGERNNQKDRQYVTDCTSNGGSVINGQCINLRDLTTRSAQ